MEDVFPLRALWRPSPSNSKAWLFAAALRPRVGPDGPGSSEKASSKGGEVPHFSFCFLLKTGEATKDRGGLDSDSSGFFLFSQSWAMGCTRFLSRFGGTPPCVASFSGGLASEPKPTDFQPKASERPTARNPCRAAENGVLDGTPRISLEDLGGDFLESGDLNLEGEERRFRAQICI